MDIYILKFTYSLLDWEVSSLFNNPIKGDELEADFNLGFETNDPNIFNVTVFYTPVQHDIKICDVMVKVRFLITDKERWPLKIEDGVKLVLEAVKIMFKILYKELLVPNHLEEILQHLSPPTEEDIRNRLKIFGFGISFS